MIGDRRGKAVINASDHPWRAKVMTHHVFDSL